jgi:hypothetical protein
MLGMQVSIRSHHVGHAGLYQASPCWACRSLSGLLSRLPSSAASVLSEALNSIRSTAIEAVAPLFKATVEAIEEKILKLHVLELGQVGAVASRVDPTVEGGSGGGAEPVVAVVNTSQYLQECVALIVSFR